MNWSDEEVDCAWSEWRAKCASHAPETALDDAMRRAMTCAVELAAARGGTMTEDMLDACLKELRLAARGGAAPVAFERVAGHISALGAMNAVLEGRLREVDKGRNDAAFECDRLRGRAAVSERDVLDARAERDAAREDVAAARKAMAEMHGKEAWESLKARAERAEAELARLKPSGHENCPDNPCPGHHPYCEGIGKNAPPPSGHVAEDAAMLRVTLPLGPSRLDLEQRISRLAALAQRTQHAERERDEAREHLRSEMEQRAAALIENDSLRAKLEATLTREADVNGWLEEMRSARDAARAEVHGAKLTLEASRAEVSRLTGVLAEAYAEEKRLRTVLEAERKASAQWEAAHRRMEDRVEALSAAGQVLSEHVDTTSGETRACAWAPAHDGQVCHACSARRYPCSPTCTHDDASTPGHPERVRERGEAFNAAGICATEQCERDAAYEMGAEAMRAACLEAAQSIMQKYGIGPAMREDMKSAIEGAAP